MTCDREGDNAAFRSQMLNGVNSAGRGVIAGTARVTLDVSDETILFPDHFLKVRGVFTKVMP
jgi:hypothetical protein